MQLTNPIKVHMFALKVLWKEAFGDTDDFLNIFFKTAFSPERCRCITDNGVPVSALYWFDCSMDSHKIAYVYAVATAKAYQGKGLAKQLLADTHTHLRSLGYDTIILVPGSPSLFNYYSNLGYQTCCSIKEWTCEVSKVSSNANLMASTVDTATTGLNIRKIDKIEFAQLRRQFLPAASVIQENENLDFLECFTSFYAGDNFLLAASIQKDQLVARELLGDATAAPYIVQALGCQSGSFRAPGNDKAFAMYYSLTKNHSTPAYFGFAFD